MLSHCLKTMVCTGQKLDVSKIEINQESSMMTYLPTSGIGLLPTIQINYLWRRKGNNGILILIRNIIHFIGLQKPSKAHTVSTIPIFGFRLSLSYHSIQMLHTARISQPCYGRLICAPGVQAEERSWQNTERRCCITNIFHSSSITLARVICSSSWTCSEEMWDLRHMFYMPRQQEVSGQSTLFFLFHSWQVTRLQHPQRTLRKSDINGKIEILLPTLQILFPWPPGFPLVLGLSSAHLLAATVRFLWKCQL